MGRIKVLQFISDMNVAGAQMVLFNLTKGLLERGNYCPLICTTAWGALADEAEKIGIRVLLLNQDRVFDTSLITELGSLIRKSKISIVHSHMWSANLYSGILFALTKKPIFIVTEHGRHTLKKKRRILMNRFIVKEADAVITVSDQLRKDMIDFGKVSPNKITTIENGIDLNRFNGNRLDRKEIRKKLDLEISTPVIGIVGNLTEVKGHRYFLEAASVISKHKPDARFLIVGDGVLREQLENQAHRLGIAQKVSFLGRRSDVPEILSALDVFVLSSEFEGIPNALLEAMAMGKPVVATKVGGVPEIVEDGYTGITVSPKNSLTLAEAITRLLKDNMLSMQMGYKASKVIRERFNVSLMVDRYEALYDNLLHRKMLIS